MQPCAIARQYMYMFKTHHFSHAMMLHYILGVLCVVLFNNK